MDQIDIDNLQLRAEECANGDCAHAREAKRATETADKYRYGVEEAIDYLDDRDGITPEVAAILRGILQRAIEPQTPTA